MNDQISKHDSILFSLVVNLQTMAMAQLGKIASPHTGEVEQDLEGARGTIDILDMLKAKTRDNTPAELVKMLDQIVMDLQMNYLEESRKGKDATEDEGAATAGEETAPEEPAAGATAADEPTERAGQEPAVGQSEADRERARSTDAEDDPGADAGDAAR